MSEVVWEVKKEVNGELLQVKVSYDDDPMSPRDNDNLGTIIGYMRRHRVYEEVAKNTEDYRSWEEWRMHELPRDVIALPVYMYNHSGISLSTEPYGDRWDSGQVGYIYATRPKIREWFSCKIVGKKVKEDAIRMLESEIEEYSNYLGGTHYVVDFIKGVENLESIGSLLNDGELTNYAFDVVGEEFEPLKEMLEAVM